MKSKLTKWNLKDKRVFVRADLNVPIQHGKIIDDYRIRAALPTIDFIQSHGGIVILATHIGRPHNKETDLSTRHLVPWFEQHGYPIRWVPTIDAAHTQSNASIILLENLRFFPGEQQGNATFAQQLAKLGEYYVDDAFATLHRDDASVALVPRFFAQDKRTIGFLVEKELEVLEPLRTNPSHPFVLMLGGKKVSDKIPLIQNLLDKVDTLILLPAIAFTFAKAMGKPVGKSLVDNNALDLCKDIMRHADEQGITILLPVDYQVAENNKDGALSIIDAEQFPDNAYGISIGPKTITLIREMLAPAHSIFFNGVPGFLERKETLKEAHKLFNIIAHANGNTIVCGGDTVAAAHLFGVTSEIDYLSTGGGATLTYLSGEPLPGLQAL